MKISQIDIRYEYKTYTLGTLVLKTQQTKNYEDYRIKSAELGGNEQATQTYVNKPTQCKTIDMQISLNYQNITALISFL